MTTDTLEPPSPATSPESASPVTAGEAPPVNGIPAAEAIAKAQEQLAPADRPLPGFEPPPYDGEEWERRIESKERGVADAEFRWQKSQKETKSLKGAFDDEVAELRALIREMGRARRQAHGELVQPSLGVPQGVAASSCRWEQLEGKPCQVCIVLRAAGSPLPDPEDTDHYELVLRALEPADAADLANWVENVSGQGLAAATVKAWTDEQRAEVQMWCAAMEQLEEGSGANEPERPAILGTPHVADVAGTSVQSCKRCKNVLLDLAKPDVFAYDEDALVGTDCEPPAVTSDTPDTPETGDTDQPTTLDDVAAAHKVCLCQVPDFEVPATSDDIADARCTICQGTPTGTATEHIRFAKKTKKGKR